MPEPLITSIFPPEVYTGPTPSILECSNCRIVCAVDANTCVIRHREPSDSEPGFAMLQSGDNQRAAFSLGDVSEWGRGNIPDWFSDDDRLLLNALHQAFPNL